MSVSVNILIWISLQFLVEQPRTQNFFYYENILNGVLEKRLIMTMCFIIVELLLQQQFDIVISHFTPWLIFALVSFQHPIDFSLQWWLCFVSQNKRHSSAKWSRWICEEDLKGNGHMWHVNSEWALKFWRGSMVMRLYSVTPE